MCTRLLHWNARCPETRQKRDARLKNEIGVNLGDRPSILGDGFFILGGFGKQFVQHPLGVFLNAMSYRNSRSSSTMSTPHSCGSKETPPFTWPIRRETPRSKGHLKVLKNSELSFENSAFVSFLGNLRVLCWSFKTPKA